MASSAGGQGGLNPALSDWLPRRQHQVILPAQDYLLGPATKISLKVIIIIN